MVSPNKEDLPKHEHTDVQEWVATGKTSSRMLYLVRKVINSLAGDLPIAQAIVRRIAIKETGGVITYDNERRFLAEEDEIDEF